VASQQKDGQDHGQDTLDSHDERNYLESSPNLSIESSKKPHTYVTHSVSLTPRSRAEDGYGTPPRYRSPEVRNIEPDRRGYRTAEVVASLPSTISGTPLRPNRLGPGGDIELGSVPSDPVTGAWVSEWASQFRSPLGGFIPLFYPLARTLTFFRCPAMKRLPIYLFRSHSSPLLVENFRQWPLSKLP
jgi:hypothetical protein